MASAVRCHEVLSQIFLLLMLTCTYRCNNIIVSVAELSCSTVEVSCKTLVSLSWTTLIFKARPGFQAAALDKIPWFFDSINLLPEKNPSSSEPHISIFVEQVFCLFISHISMSSKTKTHPPFWNFELESSLIWNKTLTLLLAFPWYFLQVFPDHWTDTLQGKHTAVTRLDCRVDCQFQEYWKQGFTKILT